jgi:hypothetical protein
MKAARFRNRRSLVLFVAWLAGVATILYFAPPVYQRLPHQWGDWLLGFRPASHDVVILSGAGEEINRTPPIIINLQRDLHYKGPVVLLNVETGERQSLPLSPQSAICKAKLVGTGNLLCQDQKRLVLINLHSGRRRDHLSGSKMLSRDMAWQVSDDGKILAYFKDLANPQSKRSPPSGQGAIRVLEDGEVVCYDLESGRTLGEYRSSEWWQPPSGLLSPGGNLVAINHAGNARILDAITRKTILSLPWGAWPSRFSPDRSLVLDQEGAVWDLATSKIRLRGRPPPQAAFADAGGLLVEAGIEADNAVFRCRDVQTGVERLRLPLPQAWHFRVAPWGANGRSVAVNMQYRPGRPVHHCWVEKLLTRVSGSPRSSPVQSQQIVFDEDYSRAWAVYLFPAVIQQRPNPAASFLTPPANETCSRPRAACARLAMIAAMRLRKTPTSSRGRFGNYPRTGPRQLSSWPLWPGR